MYLYTSLPLNRSCYLEVGLLFDWLHLHQLEPITEELSLHKQKLFFVEMELENLCIHQTLIDKVFLIIWQTITKSHASASPTFTVNSYFCQGIV